MSRVQLALNVSDIDQAVDFYRRLFGAEPAKLRPGYANFSIADPPLKLVLIQNDEQSGTLNHLGVEVADAEQVAAATRRLADEGLQTRQEEGVECCYALQDKVWVADPDGAPWEVYTVLGDTAQFASADSGCCAADSADSAESAGSGQPVAAGCC